MLAMTEKYASNLEALVDERTQLLIEEKQVWTPLQFLEFALMCNGVHLGHEDGGQQDAGHGDDGDGHGGVVELDGCKVVD